MDFSVSPSGFPSFHVLTFLMFRGHNLFFFGKNLAFGKSWSIYIFANLLPVSKFQERIKKHSPINFQGTRKLFHQKVGCGIWFVLLQVDSELMETTTPAGSTPMHAVQWMGRAS